MNDAVTVRELRVWLNTQLGDAEVRLAGVEDVSLIGWSGGTLEGKPVVLLAFDFHGPMGPA
jgi:hypothetical protein